MQLEKDLLQSLIPQARRACLYAFGPAIQHRTWKTSNVNTVLASSEPWPRYRHLNTRSVAVEFKSEQQRDRYMSRLRRDKRVDYVEPDYRLSTDALPNDPDFSVLWGLHNTGQENMTLSRNGYEDADIDASEAWDVAAVTSSVIVAVIDSGIDNVHPDISANILDKHRRNSR